MVIRELLQRTEEEIQNRREAGMILCHVLKLASPLDLILRGKEAVREDACERVSSYAVRRKAGEPLQYILGDQEFMSLTFRVTPAVLVPRADTETLVEHALARIKGDMRILEIGTGSGCIAISIAHYRPEAMVTAVDISPAALTVAKENACRNQVADRVKFLERDIMNWVPEGSFDMVISNPPYIERAVIPTLDRDVKEFEPLSALDGGADGLDFYRRITKLAPEILKENGYLCYEIGYNQGRAVKELMEEHFYKVTVVKDLCGMDRVVSGKKSE